MAGEIKVTHALSGKTVYVVIFDATGSVWQTTTLTFVAYVTANRANYDIALTELGTASGIYTGTFPAEIAAGFYDLVAYEQAGGSPAETDLPPIAVGSIEWSGSALLARSSIQADTDDIQARLPAALVSGRMDSSVGAMAADVLTAAATAADFTTEIQTGLATAAALATVQADTDDIQSRLPAALVSGRMDSSVGAMAANTFTASALASDAVAEIRSVASGTADSGSISTLIDSARTEADIDYWVGCWVLFTSGNIAGQVRLITAFSPSLDKITFAPPLTQAVTTQTYEILPAGGIGSFGEAVIGAAQFQNNAIDELVIADGAFTAGKFVNNFLTAAKIANGALDAATFAADAIDADALAQSAVDEIVDAVWDELQAGHVVAGSFAEAVANALKRTDTIDGFTVTQIFELVGAVLCGKTSGGPGGTVFRSMDDAADRVTSVADTTGDRTTVTLTP